MEEATLMTFSQENKFNAVFKITFKTCLDIRIE
jgi:hypothetical protein